MFTPDNKNPNFTIDDLKKFGEKNSTFFDINWDTIERDPKAPEMFEGLHTKSEHTINALEHVYTEMKLIDTREFDECWVNEETGMCIHDIEDRLVDAYTMRNIYARYTLINNMTL